MQFNLPWTSWDFVFCCILGPQKNQQAFTLFPYKVLTVNKFCSLLGNQQQEPWKPYKEMYEVLTFHLGNVSTVRFFPPPVVHLGELSPSQQADLKPSFASFVKKSHDQWKGGRSWFMLILILPRNSWLELVFQSQMVLCSKDLFYTRTCQQLESSPVFMCTGEVDPAMPGSTGVTFILLLLTSLVSSSL